MTLLYANSDYLTLHSQATPLVLLHGLLGSGKDWQPLIQSMPAQACLTIDLPGHGQSPFSLLANPSDNASNDWAFAATAKLIEQVLVHHNIEQCNLLGYSLGGRIAQYFACHYPHRIKQLIIESAHPGLSKPLEREQRWQHDHQWALRFCQEPSSTVLNAWYQQGVFSDLTEEQIQALIRRRSQNDLSQVAAMLLATSLSQQPDLTGQLQRAPFAVHYLCGGQDQKFHAIANSLSKNSNSVTKHIFPASGHNIHRFEPLKYKHTLMQLLAAHQ